MTKTTFNSAESQLLPDRQAAGRLVLRNHAAAMRLGFAAVARRETQARIRATVGTGDVRTYIERYESAACLRPTTLTFFCEDGSPVRSEVSE